VRYTPLHLCVCFFFVVLKTSLIRPFACSSQIVALESQISALKEDLEKEHERWRAAQANYERQVDLLVYSYF